MQTIRVCRDGQIIDIYMCIDVCVLKKKSQMEKKKKGISGQIKVYGSFKSTLLYSGGVA